MENIFQLAVMATGILGMIIGDKFMTVIFLILVGLVFGLVYFVARYLKCPHRNSGFNIRFPITAAHCPFCGGKLE